MLNTMLEGKKRHKWSLAEGCRDGTEGYSRQREQHVERYKVEYIWCHIQRITSIHLNQRKYRFPPKKFRTWFFTIQLDLPPRSSQHGTGPCQSLYPCSCWFLSPPCLPKSYPTFTSQCYSHAFRSLLCRLHPLMEMAMDTPFTSWLVRSGAGSHPYPSSSPLPSSSHTSSIPLPPGFPLYFSQTEESEIRCQGH